jgi:DNA repair exonuclease SbcCD nuclease subunit|tara:strand:+ start:4524 stop:5582 length:1059 start_codon:yes stop_codon:yes gene_type:complete
MKIALITDTHIGARNDSLQFHEYFDKFYTEFFFPYLKENNIQKIIHLGDLFDRRKYINFNSLYLSKKYLFDVLERDGYEFHCIVGNHDVTYKNTNRVNAPTLLLGEYPGLHVYEEPTVTNFGGLDILMMPWINSENYENSMATAADTKATVMMSHLELAGFEMYRGAVNDHGLSHKVFDKFDIVCSGHFHHKSSKDNIHYLGSPYEMTWSDYNDDRGFHIFDTEEKSLTYIKNPYRMFYKVFYDDTEKTEQEILDQDFSYIKDTYVKVVVKQKSNPYVFDVFVDKLNLHLPAHLQIVEDNFNLDIEDDSDIINEAEDTVSIIKKYISNLNLDNAKPVENLFYELYHDALSIE